jgi:hypothetical protein
MHAMVAETDPLSLEHVERTTQVVDHCTRDRVAAAFPFAERARREARTGRDVFDCQASARPARSWFSMIRAASMEMILRGAGTPRTE